MSRRLRVLWMSDGCSLATGFGRVGREITRRLAEHPSLELASVAWGEPRQAALAPSQFVRVYPSAAHAYGQDVIAIAVSEFKPDVVVSLGELRMVEWLARHPVRNKFRWVAYIPLDGGPFYPPWAPAISEMHEIVAMSEFGRDILQSGSPSRRVRRIYHGVDTECFRPLSTRSELKRHPRFDGRFVIGCVARNQARKNLPALILAYADMAKRHSDLHLYLHSTPSEMSFDLENLLKRFKLQGRADLASPDLTVNAALKDPQLNELYNLFDVMALPTCAEGFGLPILESLAAGVPVVATNCSACPELVAGRGELARVMTTVISTGNILEQAIVDVDDLARCIEKLYLSPALRAEYSRAGRTFAETLSWDRLMPQWFEVLSSASGVDLTAGVSEATEGGPAYAARPQP